MLRLVLGALGALCVLAGPAWSQAYVIPAPAMPAEAYAGTAAPRGAVVVPASGRREGGNMGGGFIEFLFTGGRMQNEGYARPVYAPPQPPARRVMIDPRAGVSRAYAEPPVAMPYAMEPAPIEPAEPVRRQRMALAPMPEEPAPVRSAIAPEYRKQVVPYSGKEAPGTIVVNTKTRHLYLVQGDGTALRYGIGVGRDGFQWTGVHKVTAKREWPDWRPPAEMLKRRPDLPRFMPGGPQNPLGARAMYLGSTLYRIHGSNEPWTIGHAVSSGCFRMTNEDVEDLYNRVPVGTKVIVI